MPDAIGLLVGADDGFASALLRCFARESTVRAERATIGLVTDAHRSPYRLLLDLAGPHSAHHRAFLRAEALAGAVVLDDPFTTPLTDRFNRAAAVLPDGVFAAPTFVLPQKQWAPNTAQRGEFAALQHPIDWQALALRVSFPAELFSATQPGAGARASGPLRSVPELLRAYDASGDDPQLLRTHIEAECRFRVFCVGDSFVLVTELGVDGVLRVLPIEEGSFEQLAAEAAQAVSRALGRSINAVEFGLLGEGIWLLEPSFPGLDGALTHADATVLDAVSQAVVAHAMHAVKSGANGTQWRGRAIDDARTEPTPIERTYVDVTDLSGGFAVAEHLRSAPLREWLSAKSSANVARSVVRVGVYSSDPPACDAFHSMDPESGIVFGAVSDSLVYLDRDGTMRPSLATAWKRIDPLTMEFELREGVRFHNGDHFTADDVVETIRAHRDPANRSPNGQGILSTIQSAEKVDDYCVRITTYMPDGMFLNRLQLSAAIYPKSILEREGPGYFFKHPVGTGAYIFDRWERGREIVLKRNPDHWRGGNVPDELRFPIMDQKDWVDALERRELDIALNLDPHDAYRVQGIPGLELKRREAALSHWFVLNFRGPLEDKRVRRAMNYALHRHLLANVAFHGWASPQASLLTQGQLGFDETIKPYPYDPDYAAYLLKEAGYEHGLHLRGLVSESSAGLFQLVRVFLERVGIKLEAEVVPRPEWLRRIVIERVMSGKPYDGDFAFANIDNFTLNGLFPHSIFLWSRGLFSLGHLPDYDERFLDAAIKTDPEEAAGALRALDRYAHDEALLLFTTSQQVFCGVRKGYDIPIALAAHFNYDNLWNIEAHPEQQEAGQQPYHYKVSSSEPSVQRLLDSTTYPGILYDPEAQPFEQPVLRALWRNIQLHEIRWKIQSEEMIRTLVDQVGASTNLENVLRSTKQVGILGVTPTGRVLFENSGYRTVMGTGSEAALPNILFDDYGKPAWNTVAETTEREGQSAGVYTVLPGNGERRRVFLTATPAINELGAPVGYVCILSDHSKEEERLRIAQEMQVAERIQTALLPTIAEEHRTRIAAAMIPAEEVGGDYYDIITDDSGVEWYGIGDVSGHGVTSGLIMLLTHSIITSIIRTNPEVSMDTILTKMNSVLYDDIQVRIGEGHHLTFMLLKHVGDGDFIVAGAHEDILIHRAATGAIDRIPVQGVYFGLLPDIAGMVEEQKLHLDPGDTMVLYTDGVIEAEDAAGKFFEVEGLTESIQRNAGLSVEELKQAILNDVNAFMHKQLDDITLLLLRRPAE